MLSHTELSHKEKRLSDVLESMRKIIDPGEYGLGDEPESFADDDEAAWEQLGPLLYEASDASDVLYEVK